MDSVRVAELLQCYEVMEGACGELAGAIRADDDRPLLLPTYRGESGGGREAAIRSLTRVWHPEPGESLVTAGLLCASAETRVAAELLNTAKGQFKDAVAAIREEGKKEKVGFEHLIEKSLKDNNPRNRKLKQALDTIHISRLDLVRCYTNVRVLDPDLRSISWTWATTHATIRKVTIKGAVASAEKLDDDAREYALSKLAALPSGESLAYRKPNANQLRANLAYYEGEGVRRESLPISGIVLGQDDTLPRYVWRNDPATVPPEHRSGRLSRIDTTIDEQPYIRPLYLHRYIGESHAHH